MPEPLSEEKLAELEDLHQKATRAPWHTEEAHGCPWNIEDAHGEAVALAGAIIGDAQGQPERTFNAKLIASGVNALPSLLAEVRLGREALKALGAMEDAYDHVAHCCECGETSVQRCAEIEGENSAAAKAIIALEECSRILRKARRR